METQAPPQPTTTPPPAHAPDQAPPMVAPKHGKGPLILVTVAVIALLVLLVIGILPRLRQRTALAEGVKEAKSATVEVTITKARPVADKGVTLPGNIQAWRETTINARSTGYLRDLFVDIGSRVKAGQVVAIVQAPDTDQQFLQAKAQSEQSHANVGQAQATVEQQQATVTQDRATVAHNAAGVQQSRQAVAQAQAQEAQARATEKGAEAALAHADQALAVQQAALKQSQANLDLAKVSNDRYQSLLKQGFVAQQDADQALATLETSTAAVQSAEASVTSSRADIVTAQQTVESAKSAVVAAHANVLANVDNVTAAVATLSSSQATVLAAQHTVRADVETVHANRSAFSASVANAKLFNVMKGFEKVVAPFDGVITARNVDLGTLITAGGTETGVSTSVPQTGMLGIARTDIVRIQVSVPQTYVPAIVAGSTAKVTVHEFPKRVFTGVISRRAGGLDPTWQSRR